MKLLHTSDWQIGMKARHAGEHASALRRTRLETGRKIIELAQNEAVDFIILAGDTFEDQDVEASVIEEVHAILTEAAPIPVFILPGNHDPLGSSSVWERTIWNREGNIIVLREPKEVELNGGICLYPCPLTQKHSFSDPTVWIPSRSVGDQRIRIGIAHGSLPVGGGAVNFPITWNRAEIAGLNYLALGDWHGTRVEGRMGYAGTPEQTSFGETDAGNVLIVAVADGSSEPEITSHRVGRYTWRQLELLARDATDIDDFIRKIELIGAKESLCLDVHVTIPPGSPEALHTLVTALRFSLDSTFWLNWDAKGVLSLNSAVDSIPEGFLREIFETLSGDVAVSGEGSTADLAMEARRWMLEIASEVGR
jgi:DNA repair exonuclease SbcCD nuclease subunit